MNKNTYVAIAVLLFIITIPFAIIALPYLGLRYLGIKLDKSFIGKARKGKFNYENK